MQIIWMNAGLAADLFLISIFLSFYQAVMAIKIGRMCESEGHSVWVSWPGLYISRLAGNISLLLSCSNPGSGQARVLFTLWRLDDAAQHSHLAHLVLFNISLSLSSPAQNYPINPPLTKGQSLRKTWQILSIDAQLCSFLPGVQSGGLANPNVEWL